MTARTSNTSRGPENVKEAENQFISVTDTRLYDKPQLECSADPNTQALFEKSTSILGVAREQSLHL